MSNIVLIGFMGTGKSDVGKKVAEQLGFSYLDTDEVIEKTEKKKINDIFKENGERYFRDLETEVIRTLQDYDRFVIATGGGMVLRPENVQMLKQIGPLILLYTKPEVIFERVKFVKNRPLIEEGDKQERIREILKKREPLYEKVADYKIDTSNLTIDKVVKKVIEYFKELNNIALENK
ncbi:hypothetical protein A2230_04100 [candidate division WOR-1 bacterium RIFOXYA2_FULL_36_21]|uniref:Shikimate kinase n=1 Tax=candidate division WOR-1 bacterium RIFOXYB2_FULL_36_35 TaxID=1802578 RepID=A0A1F4S8S2_UNCSA|nr:MAG: hypothetical protein A2230_04100 [candidate division WOR-1 bacterium RIFOXYA2_FULL_36_21]OGC16143.1 MAG: hypothetical protein A2290_07130 [candidate division WOR-1 bacterium RIFOXYB2_FULL_36_35]OGC16944.1 MAG: hypothetical protein A2282_00720 [candidate division WOR-1 bacterium RIFOXYA12_FULL_36_13]